MASGKSTDILANMKLPLFIIGISMVFPIISILEKFNVMLQSKTISKFNEFIFKICHPKTTIMPRINHI